MSSSLLEFSGFFTRLGVGTSLIEIVNQFSNKADDLKIKFLFRIYDVNGDGVIKESEFKEVLTASMKENGLNFDDEELYKLAHVLFIDGVEGSDTMTLDDKTCISHTNR